MQYRKKPVVIEAWQFSTLTVRPDWLTDAVNRGDVYYQGGAEPYLTIETPEGVMRAHVNDWIIRGIQGELYPCKPDIFEASYEKVS
jgi:hypothetical protein